MSCHVEGGFRNADARGRMQNVHLQELDSLMQSLCCCRGKKHNSGAATAREEKSSETRLMVMLGRRLNTPRHQGIM